MKKLRGISKTIHESYFIWIERNYQQLSETQINQKNISLYELIIIVVNDMLSLLKIKPKYQQQKHYYNLLMNVLTQLKRFSQIMAKNIRGQVIIHSNHYVNSLVLHMLIQGLKDHRQTEKQKDLSEH
jgi:hypothetical protein